MQALVLRQALQLESGLERQCLQGLEWVRVSRLEPVFLLVRASLLAPEFQWEREFRSGAELRLALELARVFPLVRESRSEQAFL